MVDIVYRCLIHGLRENSRIEKTEECVKDNVFGFINRKRGGHNNTDFHNNNLQRPAQSKQRRLRSPNFDGVRCRCLGCFRFVAILAFIRQVRRRCEKSKFCSGSQFVRKAELKAHFKSTDMLRGSGLSFYGPNYCL